MVLYFKAFCRIFPSVMSLYRLRESWKSRLGFIFAALGSAVGLGSIWRFPYIVGENGGAAFIVIYILCLLLIGFPVLVGELVIGRTAQTSPVGSFRLIGRKKFWGHAGKLTIITGFIISSFYSVIAGWGLGYLIQAIKGEFTHFADPMQASSLFQSLVQNVYWVVGYHFLFLSLGFVVLVSGVRKGIERASKILMPVLFIVLAILVVKGLFLPRSVQALKFLFSPDWKNVTPHVVLVALGQAFFTLSLGQGTMITYGSYLSRDEDIPASCFPVVVFNTIISLLMGIAVFTIVFSVGLTPQTGPALLFETLPVVFSQMAAGKILGILFFLLVVIAALTSEISALEPMISYFVDERGWSRKKSAFLSVLGAFLIGIPSAFSFNVWRGITFFGKTIFDLISFASVNILVPIGGLLAVILVGWRWGISETFDHLKLHHRNRGIQWYYRLTLRYLAPIFIILILLNLFGIY